MSSVAAVDSLAQGAGFPKFPDEFGHFGTYGGRFVAETLIKPLEELEQAYRRYLNDPLFMA
ncbi:MAG TPA: tryptophan synthase subunit beta, partial [Gammaproteobacteria bacterium]|nr:tryptophan synthase subunit beta [Gammaproteobacteria bacterium]